MRFITRAALLLAAAIGLSSGAAPAQEYPARPLRFIIPFPSGGSTDALGRTLGQKLAERWGQQVVIENRPGGNTLISAELAAKSAPDGYTLFMPIDSTLTMNRALHSKLPCDPAKSFAPVALLTRQSCLSQ
ncbi:MAG: tripartite tricarboxylate transporter substrate-binding protein [Burkholderiales bacterium]